MASWTITYQYPTEKNTADKKHRDRKKADPSRNLITSVEVVKTGTAYHKIIHWDTGAQDEDWNIQGREVIKKNSSPQYIPMTASGPVADDYSAGDFEDLSWLTMKDYAGLKPGARADFVFRARHKDRPLTRREKIAYEILKRLQPKNRDASVPPDSALIDLPDQSPDGEDTIILDATTQLPMEYDQGSVKWTYQFNPPPTSQLEPPAEVNILLEHWDAFTRSTETTGSPP